MVASPPIDLPLRHRENDGDGLALAILGGILGGAAVGLFNGFVVAWVGINSFIATLATSSVLLALASLVSRDRLLGPVDAAFKAVTGTVFGIPLLLVYVAVLATLVWYLVEHTPAGRRLNATGANLDTARLVGVATRRNIMVSLTVSGRLAAVAGVPLSSRVGTVSATVGPAYLLPAFAGCFLATSSSRPAVSTSGAGSSHCSCCPPPSRAPTRERPELDHRHVQRRRSASHRRRRRRLREKDHIPEHLAPRPPEKPNGHRHRLENEEGARA